MNNFDEWSQIISRFLKAEADLLTSVTRHDIAADSTRAAFIRGVLEPFLPSSYAIGSGRVIDSTGNGSDKIDIVIYRRDFPRLNLPGSLDVFLYESVLATIEVRTKLIRKTLFDALDTCASIAKLNPDIDPKVLKNIAVQNKLTLNNQNKYVHEHPLLTDRFNLIGRPPSFIYGFNGFQTSPSQLNDNINIWLDTRREKNLDVDLNSFPAVVATQGCIGWRNAAPLSANSNHLFGIGADAAPIRLIVLQLLYQLNRQLKVTPVGHGLKPNVDAYLSKMAPPEIQHTVGKATNVLGSTVKAGKTAPEIKKEKAATPVAAKPAAARPQPTTESKPVHQASPTVESKPVRQASPIVESKPVHQASPIVESKPVPQASPTVESRPIRQASPTVESRPVPQASPTVESKPVRQASPTVESKPVPQASPTVESKPVRQASPTVESKPTVVPKPTRAPIAAAEPTPVDASKAAAEAKPATESKPSAETDSLFDTKPVFDSGPFAKPAASPEAKAAVETRASAIPQPSLGSMYHADPTLAEMPVPDASLVPEPEPESESFLKTTPASEPLKTTPEKRPVPDPEPESDPFIQTMRIPGSSSKPDTKPKQLAVEDKTDFEIEADDPFLQTVRIPASAMPASEPRSDPFAKTIPGLQNPPKSVH